MKVDFNQLRIDALVAYNHLTKQLNDHISGDTISIDTDLIDSEMRDLRNLLCVIAAVFEPEDNDFKSVIGDVGDILVFNPHKYDLTK